MPATQASLTVDLDAVAANYDLMRRLAGAERIAPVVKADAYGLGLAPVARRLRAQGADRFFVARLAEGVALRSILGADPTIYVLDGCPPDAAGRLIQARLTPVLNDLDQIRAWTYAGGGAAALHVDTGLNRLGLRPQEAEALAEDPISAGQPNISLVLTHLACASTPGHPMNLQQAQLFDQVRALFPTAQASLANSGALFQDSAFILDMARPGICLYGGGPYGSPDSRLAPVALFEAPVLQVRLLPAGESIGYGAAFRADSSLSVAILAAGYADGVLRVQSPDGYGWLHGAPRRFLGRISMDLVAIDVSDCPAARAGDRVQLIGPQIPVDEVAQSAGTISYEILTRIGTRVRRIYKGAGQ